MSIVEGYAQALIAIEKMEAGQIDPLLEHVATEILPPESTFVEHKQLPVEEDDRGRYSPAVWNYSFGPIDVTEALAHATNRPVEVVTPLPGQAATRPSTLTQASVLITRHKTNKTRMPLPGILQMDSFEHHTIAVYDTSVEPPQLHAEYDSVPLEVNYPETATRQLEPGRVHVDELMMARRAPEFPIIQAEQAARLSWLAFLRDNLQQPAIEF